MKTLFAKLVRLLSRSKWITIGYYLVNNWLTRRRLATGNYTTNSGRRHSGKSLEDSLTYIGDVFREYLIAGRLDLEDLSAKRVLELGPGDNLGVALKFLEAGAASVVCLDKFYSKRDPGQQAMIYRALWEGFDQQDQARLADALKLGEEVHFNPDCLKYIHGTGIEEAAQLFEEGSFDLIVSRAVLEHLGDPDAAFKEMDRLLVPGGVMIHEIDFRDHGMFSRAGMHPLTFLTIKKELYASMTADSGKPNGRIISYYRDTIEALAYEHQFLVTRILGIEERFPTAVDFSEARGMLPPEMLETVRTIRPRLRDELREIDEQDLMIGAAFLVARKPL